MALVVALGGGMWLMPPGPAYACSCAQSTMQEHVRRADMVILGTLTDYDPNAGLLPGALVSGGDLIPATIAVERYYKGQGNAEIEVLSQRNEATCGYFQRIPVGSRHLLFVRSDEGKLTTSFCSGNVRLDATGEAALQELAAITGLGSPPLASTPERATSTYAHTETTSDAPDTGRAFNAALVTLNVGLLALIGTAALWAWRRRAR